MKACSPAYVTRRSATFPANAQAQRWRLDKRFSSAGWANSITGQKLAVSVSVCVLTRVAQIITAKRRDF